MSLVTGQISNTVSFGFRPFATVLLRRHLAAITIERVARVIDAGLIANAMGPAKTAAVMWASINGAFLLLGDYSFFRDITGLDPEHFIREALESHLVKDHSLGAESNGLNPQNGTNGSDAAETEIKETKPQPRVSE